jgi:hypothetical protein
VASPELARSIRKLVAMIDVPDIERALEWYASIGFEELSRFGEDGELNFGMVAFGNAAVMFRPGGKPVCTTLPCGFIPVTWITYTRISSHWRLNLWRRFTTRSTAGANSGFAM